MTVAVMAVFGLLMMLVAMALLVFSVRIDLRSNELGPLGFGTLTLTLLSLATALVLLLVGAALAVVNGLLLLSEPLGW